MRVFLLYTIVLLIYLQNVKLSPIENDEDSVDSNFDAGGIELSSVMIQQDIPSLNHDGEPNGDSSIKYHSNESYNENALLSDNENNDEDLENDAESDMKEKQYGIEIPICAQYAEVTYPLHVSHLTDCRKFYKCSNGRGYLFDCPAGQYWSVKFDRCDYPEISGCTIDGTHQFKLQKAVKPKQASDNDEFSDEGSDDESFGEFDVDPRCDGSDPFTAVHFSNSNDCTKYYKCYMGKAYVIKCPKGLNWSQRLNRCEHPSLARCTIIKPAASSMIVPSMEKSNDKRGKLNSITYNSDYIILDERCDDAGIDQLFPIQFAHPSDYRVFYKCFNSFAYKVRCPNGLHFNANKNECDYPVIA